MIRLIALVFALCFFTFPAYSQTAEEMASNCAKLPEAEISNGQVSVPGDFKSGLCWGAFSAFQIATHYADGAGTSQFKPLFKICYPDGVTTSQLIKIFLAFVERHPEQYHKEFFQVALNANKEAFPCPN